MVEFEDEEAMPEEIVQGGGIDPSPETLVHWLAEQYFGDDRFESVDVRESGAEDEPASVRFICDADTAFICEVLEDESAVRVGLATENPDLAEKLENAAQTGSESMTEFVAEAMGAEDELDHEVQHFHDEAYYFCSDIPFQHAEDLAAEEMRDELIYYLDGYLTAFYDLVMEDE